MQRTNDEIGRTDWISPRASRERQKSRTKAVNHTHAFFHAQNQPENEEFFLIYQSSKLGTKVAQIDSGQSYKSPSRLD
jgi:hypothetical protein